jgi:hypothetical protein
MLLKRYSGFYLLARKPFGASACDKSFPLGSFLLVEYNKSKDTTTFCLFIYYAVFTAFAHY